MLALVFSAHADEMVFARQPAVCEFGSSKALWFFKCGASSFASNVPQFRRGEGKGAAQDIPESTRLPTLPDDLVGLAVL